MKNSLLILIFFGFATYLSAQQNTENWQNFAYSERITSFQEDNNSYYFGTRGGLLSIEKNTGQRAFKNRANSSVPSNMVEGIGIDQLGSFWIGTYDAGLAIISGQNTTIYDENNSLLPSNVVYKVISDDNNIKYAATKGGMVKIDGQQWTVIPHNDFNWFVEQMEVDNSTGSVWCMSNHTLIEITANNVIGDHVDSLGLGYVFFKDMRLDKNDVLWVTDGMDLFRHDHNGWATIDTATLPGAGTIWHLAINKDGNIVMLRDQTIATFDNGVWATQALSAINAPGIFPTFMDYDQDGNLWLGDIQFLYQYKNGIWTGFQHSNAPLTTNYVKEIANDDNGNVYITEFNGRLLKFDGTDWSEIPQPAAFSSTSETAMHFGSNGHLYVATSSKGLYVYDGSSWTGYNMANSAMVSDEIYHMVLDDMNNVWCGTPYDGLMKFDGNNWTIYNVQNSDLPHNAIKYLSSGTNGNVWIATGSGDLTKFDGQNFTDHPLSAYWGANNGVWCIKADKNDNVWIGSYGKELVKYDGQDFTTFVPGNGITTKRASEIEVDAAGNIWIAVDREGIVKYDHTSFTSYNYFNSPITSNEVNALQFDSNNNLWILTDPNYQNNIKTGNGGISVFSPNIFQGIEDISSSTAIKIYPNPTKDNITIDLSAVNKDVDIHIYNISGQVVGQRSAKGSAIETLSLEGLKRGVYFIKVKGEGYAEMHKLILQ